ncbi:MAG: AMP-binding protein, partial [Alphaproteobacteria bacterium]|nr:AMP-binding protein [Alphaproteobacteria bacterium]
MTDTTQGIPKHPGLYAERTPDRLAVVMAGSGQSLTFGEFEAHSNRCAQLMRALGLARGDGFAILMENNLHYLPLVWGALRAGLRVTAIATHLTPAEVDYILDDSGAKVLMTSEGKRATAEKLRLSNIAPGRRLFLGGHGDGYANLEAALERQPAEPIADQCEGIEMLYSSGTTGQPKGVRKPLPDLPFGVPPIGHRRAMQLYGLNEETVYLSPAPLYHAAPLGYNLRTLRAGGMTVVMEKFEAERALALIEKHRVTHSQWVPTHFIRLLRLTEEVRAKYDLSSHRCAIHAASPCPVPVKHQMMQWWGPIINEYYGGSEGNGITAISAEEWLARPGSVGRAMLGTLRICDDDGREVQPHVEGTVFFEGGPPFEYHNDPEKTAQSRNAEGWSTLGDIGYVDEDGYLYLTDRRAFVIISGGVNIYPQEAENLLASHPEVLDVAVIGVPNAEFGEEVKAVV